MVIFYVYKQNNKNPQLGKPSLGLQLAQRAFFVVSIGFPLILMPDRAQQANAIVENQWESIEIQWNPRIMELESK